MTNRTFWLGLGVAIGASIKGVDALLLGIVIALAPWAILVVIHFFAAAYKEMWKDIDEFRIATQKQTR